LAGYKAVKRLAEPQKYSSGTISGTTAKGRNREFGAGFRQSQRGQGCNRFPCSEFSAGFPGTLTKTACQSL
jgi:hypothetical protein